MAVEISYIEDHAVRAISGDACGVVFAEDGAFGALLAFMGGNIVDHVLRTNSVTLFLLLVIDGANGAFIALVCFKVVISLLWANSNASSGN